MSEQLELAIPWPYTFARPLEVHTRDPGLELVDLLPLVKGLKNWSYSPTTGLVIVAHPLPDLEDE